MESAYEVPNQLAWLDFLKSEDMEDSTWIWYLRICQFIICFGLTGCDQRCYTIKRLVKESGQDIIDVLLSDCIHKIWMSIDVLHV